MADNRLVVKAELDFDTRGLLNFDKLIKKNVKGTTNLEKRVVKLGSTSKNSSRKMNKMLDEYNSRAKKSNSLLTSTIKSIGLLAGAYMGVAKAKESIKLASDMAETQQKMNVVFGKMSGDANKWAEDYSKSMGMSILKTKESMGDIQNLFTGFGMGREESFKMSKQIVEMSNDLDSFNNLSSRGVDVGKTMISALMGQTESAKTLGAVLLENNLNLASQEMGLGKYNNKWDEATKIQVRFHAIQMQSLDSMGDVPRNLKTEVGIRRRLNSEIERTKIAIGEKLMPLQIKLMEYGTEFVEVINKNIYKLDGLGKQFKKVYDFGLKFIEILKGTTTQSRLLQGALGIVTGAFITYKAVATSVFILSKSRTIYMAAVEIPTIFKKNIAIIASTAATVGEKIADIASNAVKIIKNGITWLAIAATLALNGATLSGTASILASTIATTAGSIATGIYTAGQWLLNAALTANPIGLVIAGVALLAAGFIYAYKKIEPFQKIIDKLWATIKKFGGKALELIFGVKLDKTTNETTTKTEKSIPGNVPKYASGTDFHKGGMAIVGEQGRELVDLPRGSRVTNNNSTNSILNKSNTLNNSKSNISVQGDTININISSATGNVDEIWKGIKVKLNDHNRRKRTRIISSLNVGGV